MSEAPIIAATYVEWKMIKTRKVLQLVFETPLEQMQDVLTKLGAPRPDRDDWYGIVALEGPRDPLEATAGSRPPDTAEAPQPHSEPPGGANHDDCPHDWYRDRCQICGDRADTAAELGGAIHHKYQAVEDATQLADAQLSTLKDVAVYRKNLSRSDVAERRRYAAFLRSVRDYPKNPEFQEWVARKLNWTAHYATEDQAGEYIRCRCEVPSRVYIKTDEIVYENFLKMEAEFDADTPGRLAERRG